MTAPAVANDPSEAFNQTYNAIQSGGVQIKQIPVFDENTGSESMKAVVVDAKGNQLPADAVVPGPNGQYQIQIGSAGGTIHTTVTADPKTGTVAPVTDYNAQVGYTGGSPGSFLASTTNAVNQMVGGVPMLSLIPGVSEAVAGLNAVNSLAKGKIDVGTVLNGLTAATGLGGNLGLDPSTISNIKTAKDVASGVNAVEKGNLAGALTSLNNLTGILPSGSSQVGNVISGIAALKKNDLAGALSSLSSLTDSPDLKVAAEAANVIKQISPFVKATTGTPAATPVASSSTSSTQPASSTQAASQPLASLISGIATPQTSQTVAGPIVTYDMEGVYNPFVTNTTQTVKMSAKGGSIGLPSLLRS
jgi:hypothetical protein